MESLLNSILGFIKFINGKNSYKKRDNLCSSFDDLIGNKGNHSLSFYTNGLFSINLNDLTEFINVLDSYNSEYQFYFLNNLINFFGDENLFNPLRIILDDVSFIEFLLLHENEDKKKSFVLKCGILCSGVFPDEDIKSLEKRLEGLYEIRSHIIHGSTELISKLESKYGSYLKFNDIEISNTFRNRQSNLLSSASIYLDFYLANILRKFINDNDLVKFIKNN